MPCSISGGSDTTTAPLITVLDTLVARPLLVQARLTTRAAWVLLLREAALLQSLKALQGLFFQHQGDWVELLLHRLEPLLCGGSSDSSGGGAAAAGDRSHRDGGIQGNSSGSSSGGRSNSSSSAATTHALSAVGAQVHLEEALAASCLASAGSGGGSSSSNQTDLLPTLTLTLHSGRQLPGWSTGSTEVRSAGAAAAATDALVLGCSVPWPLALLVGPEELSEYAQVFSVLLRLRRLQQRLKHQWALLAARPTGRRPTAAATAEGGRQQAAAVAATAAAAAPRLAQLRRWHALGLHAASSILGHMLAELSGGAAAGFERSVTAAPMSLTCMRDAHRALLTTVRRVCQLPAAAAATAR